MRHFGALVIAALLGVCLSTYALGAEPISLSDVQLDSIRLGEGGVPAGSDLEEKSAIEASSLHVSGSGGEVRAEDGSLLVSGQEGRVELGDDHLLVSGPNGMIELRDGIVRITSPDGEIELADGTIRLSGPQGEMELELEGDFSFPPFGDLGFPMVWDPEGFQWPVWGGFTNLPHFVAGPRPGSSFPQAPVFQSIKAPFQSLGFHR